MLYKQRGCPGIQERCVERRATAMYDMERVPSKMEVDMRTHTCSIYIYICKDIQGYTYNMHVHDCALVSKSGCRFDRVLIGRMVNYIHDTGVLYFFCRGDLGKTWIYHGYNMDEPF